MLKQDKEQEELNSLDAHSSASLFTSILFPRSATSVADFLPVALLVYQVHTHSRIGQEWAYTEWPKLFIKAKALHVSSFSRPLTSLSENRVVEVKSYTMMTRCSS